MIQQLALAAESMVQGSLSEMTRQCGDPSCACSHDPARRHGPHLYLKFNSEGKTYSVYIPAEHGPAAKGAHRAWLRFQGIAADISAANRDRFLRALQHDKQMAKANKARSKP